MFDRSTITFEEVMYCFFNYVFDRKSDFECGQFDLINERGTCVDEKEQFLRVARPYAYDFNPGVDGNETKTIQKCSSTHTPYGKTSN